MPLSLWWLSIGITLAVLELVIPGTYLIWFGFAAGCAVLAILFFLIQHGALRIPLRPFFIVTSALMFLLAVSFTGSGIEELQEGEVISMTRIEGFPTIDVLGIYPTYETLIPQLLLIVCAVLLFMYKSRKTNVAAEGQNC